MRKFTKHILGAAFALLAFSNTASAQSATDTRRVEYQRCTYDNQITNEVYHGPCVSTQISCQANYTFRGSSRVYVVLADLPGGGFTLNNLLAYATGGGEWIQFGTYARSPHRPRASAIHLSHERQGRVVSGSQLTAQQVCLSSRR